VRTAGLSPAAIRVLYHAQPLRSLLNVGLVMIYAYRLQAAQHQPYSVNVIYAPASEPGAIGFLLITNELQRSFHGGMIFVVAVRREHLENPACDIHRRWIQHGVVVGKRNVLEDHSVVVFVERSPSAITALHGKDPIDRALDRLPLIAAVWMLDVGQRQANHGAVIHVWIKFVVEFEIP